MKEFASSPHKNSRRQDLPKYYRENGAIYIIDVEKLKNPLFEFYDECCVAYIMDKARSIDIDDMQDFVFAETAIKQRDNCGKE